MTKPKQSPKEAAEARSKEHYEKTLRQFQQMVKDAANAGIHPVRFVMRKFEEKFGCHGITDLVLEEGPEIVAVSKKKYPKGYFENR